MYHGGTYPRTLAFEVLNFTNENGWNNKFFIGFHKRTPKFLYSWNKTCKTPTGFFQLLCQMTLAKISSITHRQNRYLPSDARAFSMGIACKVNLCDICRFRTRRFSISKWAAENKFFYRGLLIKSVRTSSWISVLSFARAKYILCACPTVGSVRG